MDLDNDPYARVALDAYERAKTTHLDRDLQVRIVDAQGNTLLKGIVTDPGGPDAAYYCYTVVKTDDGKTHYFMASEWDSRGPQGYDDNHRPNDTFLDWDGRKTTSR